MSVEAEHLTVPSWSCVHFTHEAPGFSELAALGVDPDELDGGLVEDKATLMAALAEALEFPDYFGGNWDAVDECLRSLEFDDASARTLVVRGSDGLWRRDPEICGNLVRAWLSTAQLLATRGLALHLVFEW